MSGSPLHTRIWREEPEPDNAFAARAAYCHGYDVYGEMLGRASWTDMLCLLFTGEAPTPAQGRLLNALAVALANPGPRDPMVHAAMCGGIGGSHAAASLMAALAVGAGQSGGARDVFLAMQNWAACDKQGAGGNPQRHAAPVSNDAKADQRQIWIDTLTRHAPRQHLAAEDMGWPDIEHPAGFDPHGVRTATTVRQTLETLAGMSPGHRLMWLAEHRAAVEATAGLPLSMIGVTAAALADLGLNARQGEMMFLLLRLPGAAAHALEQGDYGFKRFPYPEVDLQDDPLHAATRPVSTESEGRT